MSNLTTEKRKLILESSIGTRFGSLVVVKQKGYKITPSGRKVPKVLCKCDCGKSKVVSLWDLKAKKTRTCGFDHPTYLDRTIPAFNKLYTRYKRNARDGQHSFNLSRDEFRNITQSPCHYCGIAPSAKQMVNHDKEIYTLRAISTYVYNGIDRVDSNKGYEISNVVPCCKICNHAKHTMSYKDFMVWLNRVSRFAETRSKNNLYFVIGGENV